MVLATVLCSCGKVKQNDVYHYVENTYDDSRLLAYELIQNARLDALEMEANLVEGELAVINDTLTDIQNEVSVGAVSVVKICASAESLIKTNTGFFAVYMVSNNYGTYLGQLTENTTYQTTDATHVQFKILNGSIVCL
jgi:hypothetical protein